MTISKSVAVGLCALTALTAACLVAGGGYFAGRSAQHDRAEKWKANWQALSLASASDSSAWASVAASASASAGAASASAEGHLNRIRASQEAARHEIIRQASGSVDPDHNLPAGLIGGLGAAHDRLCADAKAEGQDGICPDQADAAAHDH